MCTGNIWDDYMVIFSLKGNVMNGPIGKQMVDTLVESQANVEVIKCLFELRCVLSPKCIYLINSYFG